MENVAAAIDICIYLLFFFPLRCVSKIKVSRIFLLIPSFLPPSKSAFAYLPIPYLTPPLLSRDIKLYRMF